MAELTIDAKEISSVLRQYVTDFKTSVEREEVGYVKDVGDGIARVTGLPGAMANEMLEFTGGTIGLAVGVVVSSWVGRAAVGRVAGNQHPVVVIHVEVVIVRFESGTGRDGDQHLLHAVGRHGQHVPDPQ